MGIAFYEIIRTDRNSNYTEERKLIEGKDRSLLSQSSAFPECTAQICTYYSDTICCITCTNMDIEVVNRMVQNLPGKEVRSNIVPFI